MAQQPLSYNNSNVLRPSALTQPALLGVTNATVLRPAISLKGGKRKKKNTIKSRKSRRGGFYPAVMSPIGTSGVSLIGPALTNVYKLFNRKSRRHSKRRSRR